MANIECLSIKYYDSTAPLIVLSITNHGYETVRVDVGYEQGVLRTCYSWWTKILKEYCLRLRVVVDALLT